MTYLVELSKTHIEDNTEYIRSKNESIKKKNIGKCLK